jgi:hypothetical protein
MQKPFILMYIENQYFIGSSKLTWLQECQYIHFKASCPYVP